MKVIEVPRGLVGCDTSAGPLTRAQARALKAAGMSFIWRYTGLPHGGNITPAELQDLTNEGMLVAPVQFFRSADWNAGTGAADGVRMERDALAAGFLDRCHAALDLEGSYPANDASRQYAEQWRLDRLRRIRYAGPGYPFVVDGDVWHSGAIVPTPESACILSQSRTEVNVTRGGVIVDLDTVTGPGLFMQGPDMWAPPPPNKAILPDLHGLALGKMGDTPGAKLWRAVEFFVGDSLSTHRDLLVALAAIDDPKDPEIWAQLRTNCATSMRWILALCGCPNTYVTQHDQVGTSMTWLLEAAREMGALIPVKTGHELELLDVGWGIHYGTPGRNNDHVEWCGEKPDKDGMAHHAGGGRADNAITEDIGDIRHSLGRPPLHLINPAMMGIPTPYELDSVGDWRPYEPQDPGLIPLPE